MRRHGPGRLLGRPAEGPAPGSSSSVKSPVGAADRSNRSGPGVRIRRKHAKEAASRPTALARRDASTGPRPTFRRSSRWRRRRAAGARAERAGWSSWCVKNGSPTNSRVSAQRAGWPTARRARPPRGEKRVRSSTPASGSLLCQIPSRSVAWRTFASVAAHRDADPLRDCPAFRPCSHPSQPGPLNATRHVVLLRVVAGREVTTPLSRFTFTCTLCQPACPRARVRRPAGSGFGSPARRR